jgi:hypothetical protein
MSISKDNFSKLFVVSDEILKKLNLNLSTDFATLATDFAKTINIYNGDVIEIKDSLYTPKYIWNDKAIFLNKNEQKNYIIPKEITINSYGRNNYFEKSLGNNYTLWFDIHEYKVLLRKTEVKKNMNKYYDENEKKYNENIDEDDLMYEYQYTFTKENDEWYLYSFIPLDIMLIWFDIENKNKINVQYNDLYNLFKINPNFVKTKILFVYDFEDYLQWKKYICTK